MCSIYCQTKPYPTSIQKLSEACQSYQITIITKIVLAIMKLNIIRFNVNCSYYKFKKEKRKFYTLSSQKTTLETIVGDCHDSFTSNV